MAVPARPRDAGQMIIGLLIGVLLIVLMITARVLIPIGQATDQRAGAGTAADAAALGAADALNRSTPVTILSAIAGLTSAGGFPGLLNGLDCGPGSTAAVSFANQNRAAVTGYDCAPFVGQTDVWVRGDDAAMTTGDHSVSHARARYGIQLARCVATDVSPTPSPTPTPSPMPTPTPTPTPTPPDGLWTVVCGSLVLHFTVDGVTGIPTLTSPTPAAITALFDDKPRLVQ